MRGAVVVMVCLVVGCDPDVDPAMPDAGPTPDAYVPPGGSAYWDCFQWSGPTKCAPRCANKTLLGRPTFGAGCEIAPGVLCEQANMTGPAERGGACCVVAGDKVELVPCS